MPLAVCEMPETGAPPRGGEAARRLVLARLAGEKSVTRSELARDVGVLMSHRLSPAEIRDALGNAVDGLCQAGLLQEKRGRLGLTHDGVAASLASLGARKAPADWSEARDVHLIGQALGLGSTSPRQLKSLSRPDGLRAVIVAKAFGLKVAIGASPARVRGQLAVVALERAFGNKLQSSMERGAGLPAKMGRLLAAQLMRRPREMGTDGRLLAALAAESVGAPRPTIDAIRFAVLRGHVGRLIDGEKPVTSGPAPRRREVPEAQEGSGFQARLDAAAGAAVSKAAGLGASVRPPAATRPDLKGFVEEVYRSAEAHAEGWSGNRKAFICHVWRDIAARFPEWGLSEVEFKSMLTEAHRTGHLVLVNADLRDKRNMAELQASAISYKNTVWHYVRLRD